MKVVYFVASHCCTFLFEKILLFSFNYLFMFLLLVYLIMHKCTCGSFFFFFEQQMYVWFYMYKKSQPTFMWKKSIYHFVLSINIYIFETHLCICLLLFGPWKKKNIGINDYMQDIICVSFIHHCWWYGGWRWHHFIWPPKVNQTIFFFLFGQHVK